MKATATSVSLGNRLGAAYQDHQRHEQELMARTPALLNHTGWLSRLIVRMLRVLRI
jgi:hypothetical protein